MSKAFTNTLLIISVTAAAIFYYAYTKEKNHSAMLKHELDVVVEQKSVISNELSKLRLKVNNFE